jgi:hypothetical protein
MSSPSPGVVTHVSGSVSGGGNVNSNSFSTNTGSAIYVFCVAATGVFTVTDNKGNHYVSAGAQVNNTSDVLTLAAVYANNITGGANTIWSVTSNVNQSIDYYVVEMVGAGNPSLNQYFGNTGLLGDPTHGPVTTNTTNQYVLSFFADNGTAVTFTPSNSFTQLANTTTHTVMGVAAPTAGVYDPAVTFAPSGGRTQIITLSVLSSGGGTVPNLFKLYANGAIQANVFTPNVALPPKVVLRLGANNVLQANGLITINGGGKLKIQANGQLICNNTIVV